MEEVPEDKVKQGSTLRKVREDGKNKASRGSTSHQRSKRLSSVKVRFKQHYEFMQGLP